MRNDARFPRGLPWGQRGGMLGLLIALLAVGLLAWLALRSFSGSSPSTAGAPAGQQAVLCTQRITELVQRTGGIGPDYQAGYEALPRECQKLTPPPAATNPRPDPDH